MNGSEVFTQPTKCRNRCAVLMCACKNAGSGPLRLSHYTEGLSQYAYLLIEAGDGLQVSGNVRTVFFRLAKILEIGSPSNLFSVNASTT